jgi:hypothetical protein
MKKAFAALAVIFVLSACASSPDVKKEQYAKLSNTRTLQYDFPTVWKGIEEAFRGYKILERDPNKVDDLEMKHIRKRTLETDWIYSQSRDKYQETKVNGVPQRVPLQVRLKYKVTATSRMAGTDVTVNSTEEIEKLDNYGTSEGYHSVEAVDTAREADMVEKINMAVLSAAP